LSRATHFPYRVHQRLQPADDWATLSYRYEDEAMHGYRGPGLSAINRRTLSSSRLATSSTPEGKFQEPGWSLGAVMTRLLSHTHGCWLEYTLVAIYFNGPSLPFHPWPQSRYRSSIRTRRLLPQSGLAWSTITIPFTAYFIVMTPAR
jgi:hypothetical protein